MKTEGLSFYDALGHVRHEAYSGAAEHRLRVSAPTARTRAAAGCGETLSVVAGPVPTRDLQRPRRARGAPVRARTARVRRANRPPNDLRRRDPASRPRRAAVDAPSWNVFRARVFSRQAPLFRVLSGGLAPSAARSAARGFLRGRRDGRVVRRNVCEECNRLAACCSCGLPLRPSGSPAP